MKSYLGYDIIYSEDDNGWYAQDFSDPMQPTSDIFDDIEILKEAIRSGTVVFH